MNKIIFNGVEMDVLSCFPYRNENGKDVLKVIIDGSVPFEEIKKLDGYAGVIQYFENDILKTEYSNYSADFIDNYKLGMHNIELTRVGATEIELQKTKEALKLTEDALEELILMVMGGMS